MRYLQRPCTRLILITSLLCIGEVLLRELLAGALLPLLLLYALRCGEEEEQAVIPLGLIVAAAWLTNIPAAVIVNYSLALLIVILAIFQAICACSDLWRARRFLGAALAAFFLVPAAYERRWVNISEVLSPGVRPQDNFLFAKINDADHNRFNLLVSLVATAEMIVLAVAIFFSRRWRQKSPALWYALIGWVAFAVFGSTFRSPRSCGCILPELRFLQLPWRWLLCLNVTFALLVTMASQRWISRLLICLAMLAVLAFVWYRVQPPWWETAEDFGEMLEQQKTGAGYEGTDEYVPAGADSYGS